MSEDFDLTATKRLSQTELVAEQKQTGAASLLSDAYNWAGNHKLEVGLALGAMTVGAAALSLLSRTRGAMAEFYGPGAENLGVKATEPLGLKAAKFVAHDDAILGGRIGVAASRDALPGVSLEAKSGAGLSTGKMKGPDLADANPQALNARLHEIPTFSEMPWDRFRK